MKSRSQVRSHRGSSSRLLYLHENERQKIKRKYMYQILSMQLLLNLDLSLQAFSSCEIFIFISSVLEGVFVLQVGSFYLDLKIDLFFKSEILLLQLKMYLKLYSFPDKILSFKCGLTLFYKQIPEFKTNKNNSKKFFAPVYNKENFVRMNKKKGAQL